MTTPNSTGFSLWALHARCSRSRFALWMAAILGGRYALDVSVTMHQGHQLPLPWDLSMFLLVQETSNDHVLRGAPWFIAELGFLWIVMTFCLRRAGDAGITPWISLLALHPCSRLILVLLLVVCPTSARPSWRFGPLPPIDPNRPEASQALAFIAVGIWIMTTVVMVVGISIAADSNYGRVAFYLAPFLGTLFTSFHWSSVSRSKATTTAWGTLFCILGIPLLLFLLAIEGAICLILALPLIVPPAIFGGCLGHVMAQRTVENARLVAAATLGVYLLLASLQTKPEFSDPIEVMTSVEIEAPPKTVWHHVVAFSEITEEAPWWFRVGLAYPLRARIDGEGVGAVRHCEFSTGPFVEPITAWEPPHRLAFDVVAQPPPMHELSFYDIHPPHLESTWVSRRGEFRLIPLSGGRTRLEGRTWYVLAIDPLPYWAPLASSIIHQIHGRVLRHIARQAEAR